MVQFVRDESVRAAPTPLGAMMVKLAFGDSFDQEQLELLFEACFARLAPAGSAGIFAEEDQHDRGVLHPNLGPPYDDANDEQDMACVFSNGEGRTFIAIDGSWSVRCKAWVDGPHSQEDHQDFHVILTGEQLLRVVVELRPEEWLPDAGIYSVVESTCPFWGEKGEEKGEGEAAALAAAMAELSSSEEPLSTNTSAKPPPSSAGAARK